MCFFIKLTLLLSVLVFPLGPNLASKVDSESKELRGKKELINREKVYFRNKPMSNELKTFIKHFKMNKKREVKGRSKRLENEGKQNLYVVKNGKVVPVKNANPLRKSTVVDIDPLNNAMESQAKASMVQFKRENLKDSGSDVTPTAFYTDKLFDKIVHDISDIAKIKDRGSKPNGGVGIIHGCWNSEVAGVRFNISKVGCNGNSPLYGVSISERDSPHTGFMSKSHWVVTLEVPFPYSGLVIVVAKNLRTKQVATFIGECRICDEVESVSGEWMLGRPARSCRDEKASHKIMGDVWTKEHLYELRSKHLEELKMTLNSTT